MAKKVAVLAVNPVNGMGLFQYLETFYENKIAYTLFAVADTKSIHTNSGVAIEADAVIADLKGHEAEFDAVVFACGDAVPVFAQNATKPYNVDLMAVLAAFGAQRKPMIGHCGAGLLFELAGVTEGRRVALHPMVQSMIQKGTATGNACEVDGNLYTAEEEHHIAALLPEVLKVLA